MELRLGCIVELWNIVAGYRVYRVEVNRTKVYRIKVYTRAR